MANKKALMLASVASMIGQFNIPNIEILQFLGYQVDVVANFTNPGPITAAKAEDLRKRLNSMNIRVKNIEIPRSLHMGMIFSAYNKVKKLVDTEHYDLIHCHSPIGGGICRMASRKERRKGTRIIYTAHGFHFFKGAPLKNWIIFYPIEKWLSRYTDVLITINKEDYKRAKEHFHARETVYIPGVGVDTKKFNPRKSGRQKIRAELGLSDSQVMLLSVGEMNKNHESVIRAVVGLDVVYVIIGEGGLEERLRSTAKECGVDLRLIGFRDDVSDFYDAADVYVLPSLREGLNVSLMEAMASGLPVACARIRGNTDLIERESVLFSPTSTLEIKSAICEAISNKENLGNENIKKIKYFNLEAIEKVVTEIYQGRYEHLLRLLSWQKKRTEIGVPWSAKLLISVGELSKRKNHKVVVKALQELPKEYWYIIVGQGELRGELLRSDKTGRLIVLGFRTDIVELLHIADLFVFPSLQEGLPVALMEAAAAGLPCIVSQIRGNTDLISDCKLMFHPKSVAEVKETIESINKMNFKELGKNNSQRMQNFNIDIVNNQMQEVYRWQ